MTWPGDAQTWLDVADHVLVGLILLAVAAVPSWFAARNHSSIQEIKGQVVNGHADAPPLRADMDRLTEAVAQVHQKVDWLARRMTEDRDEAAAEKSVRRAEIRELREDVDARFRDLNRRMD